MYLFRPWVIQTIPSRVPSYCPNPRYAYLNSVHDVCVAIGHLPRFSVELAIVPLPGSQLTVAFILAFSGRIFPFVTTSSAISRVKCQEWADPLPACPDVLQISHHDDPGRERRTAGCHGWHWVRDCLDTGRLGAKCSLRPKAEVESYLIQSSPRMDENYVPIRPGCQ